MISWTSPGASSTLKGCEMGMQFRSKINLCTMRRSNEHKVVHAGRRKTLYSHPAMRRIFALKESLLLPAILHSRFSILLISLFTLETPEFRT
jgi:hypothetical protein